MGKEPRGIKPLRTNNLIGNIGFHYEGRAYAASAVLTKDHLVVYVGGTSYQIKKQILFTKSIRECINDILNEFKKERTSEVTGTAKDGDKSGS